MRKTTGEVTNKITRLYLLALSAIALLSIAGQILVQRSLGNQLNDSRVINIAGRQRMLSQRVCKSSILLANKNGAFEEHYLNDLSVALSLWRESHIGLRDGFLKFLDIPVKNSDTIRLMFENIDPVFNKMFSNAQKIFQYYKSVNASPDELSNIYLIELLKYERSYLDLMDKIVFQYQVEATTRVNHSRLTEFILLVFTLIVLLLEGLFVFRPAVGQIKNTIEKLVQSEEQTQRVNKELKILNKSLKETREALLEANNQRHLKEINRQKVRSTYLIEGQEEERKRIAREIHDGLGQMLTALKFGFEKLADSVSLGEASRESIEQLQSLIAQTINETRTISFNLMPSALSDFGISSALKILATQVSNHSGIQVLFSTNLNSNRLAKNVEVGLYRISQEAIHNAIKYSKATEIKVNISIKKKFVHLKISDNGKGFSYGEINADEGLGNGISNMKQRAFMINGEIKFSTRIGNGTEIIIKTPSGIE